MVCKIIFNFNLASEIENERETNGEYNQFVYFWDCVKNERFDSVEHARDFIKNKVDSVDKDKVKIVEDRE